MIMGLVFILVIAVFVFTYHYERNGNPLPVNDAVSRLFWAMAFGCGYGALILPQFHIFPLCYLIVSQWLAITLIPHAFAQRMGHRTDAWSTLPLKKYWPGWIAAQVLQARTIPRLYLLQDFFGMGAVGLLRGVIVFLVPSVIGWCGLGGWLAIALTALWQPASYFLGYKTPYNVWDNHSDSPEWGEFYVSIGWAVALLVAICVG